MATRIKLTDENFGKIDKKGWYHLHVTEPVKQQILDDHNVVDRLWKIMENLNNLQQENIFSTSMTKTILQTIFDGIGFDTNTGFINRQLPPLEQENKKLKEENDSFGSMLQESTHREKILKQKLEKIKRYKDVIKEAKNKAKSPLEHSALQSAEDTLKEILGVMK